jgi:hypothetical protein
MSQYRKDIMLHKEKVSLNIKRIMDELYGRQLSHDNDKIVNDAIFEPYDKYSDRLRSLKFGSVEYNQLLNNELSEAIDIHSQNRHHFNSNQYKQEYHIDLVDLLEHICDVRAALERNLEYTDEQIRDKLIGAFNIENISNLPNISNLIENTINNYF